MQFDLQRGLIADPAELGCCISGGAQQSSGSSQSQGSGASEGQSLTLPSNFQNPSFTGLAPNTANALFQIGAGAGTGAQNGVPSLNPTMVGSTPSNSSANPLVAPVTGAQQNTLGGIGSLVNALPQNLGGAFSALQNEMSPNFAASLAGSPQTAAAEAAAIQPIKQTFNAQTVPGLQGSFTQAGQRVGHKNGLGSSAFTNAFANAQGNELATEAATTGQIANNAYQTGLNITANAPGQVGALTSSELNDMISGLNAQALPQLTQQLGISAGTQLYQQQMATILQALGLQVQGEQPSLGYSSESANAAVNNEESTGQNSSSGFNLGISGSPGGIGNTG